MRIARKSRPPSPAAAPPIQPGARYPNNIPEARAAFAEIVAGGVDPEQIIAAAGDYAAATAGIERRYVMYLATWLRRGFAAGAPQPARPSRAARLPGRSLDEWRQILRDYKANGDAPKHWPPGIGLPPQKDATRVPEALRREFGYII